MLTHAAEPTTTTFNDLWAAALAFGTLAFLTLSPLREVLFDTNPDITT